MAEAQKVHGSESRQYCTFFLGDFFFGVAVERVQEVISYQEMTRAPKAPPVVRGLINLRGQIVTAIDLLRLLEIGESSLDKEPMNIVIGTDDGAVSFLVDRIEDIIEVDESGFEHPPETLQGVARELIEGAYKLPNRLLLVLDAGKAVEMTTW